MLPARDLLLYCGALLCRLVWSLGMHVQGGYEVETYDTAQWLVCRWRQASPSRMMQVHLGWFVIYHH